MNAMRPSFISAAVLAVGLAVTQTSQGGIGKEPLQAIVNASSAIVLAEVVESKALGEGDWVATAQVLETWKGNQRSRVQFGPARHQDPGTWDASTARHHERIVFILTDDPAGPNATLRIAMAGYGRLPVIAVGGREYLDIGAGFFTPEEANAVRAQIPNADFAVPLSWLRDYVKGLTNRPQSPGK